MATRKIGTIGTLLATPLLRNLPALLVAVTYPYVGEPSATCGSVEMQDTKTRSLIDRILPGTTVHSAVAALKGLKVEKRNRITLFGYLMLVVALLAGTLASRLLLL